MKLAVFALICMYVIVQTCGKIIITQPGIAYYRAVFNGRKLLVQPSSISTTNQYYNQKNAYKQKHHYLQTITTSDGRRMIVPLTVPITQYPVGGVSSSSYNAAAHSASSAAHRNQHSYNYQQAILTDRRNNDAVAANEDEDVEEIQTVPTCQNQMVNVANEEPESEDDLKVASNVEKYRKEICLYISPKINSLLMDMPPENAEVFINDFVSVVDKYCDFANLEE